MMENAAAQRPLRRPLMRVPDRACSRPGCPALAIATLSMQYGEQQARLTDLTAQKTPERYDLCGPHADRTDPPRGWHLDDQRSDEEVVPVSVAGPRSVDDTLALLTAALHEPALATSSTDPRDDLLPDDLLEDEVEEQLVAVADAAPALEPDPVNAPVPASPVNAPAPVRPATTSWAPPAARRDER